MLGFLTSRGINCMSIIRINSSFISLSFFLWIYRFLICPVKVKVKVKDTNKLLVIFPAMNNSPQFDLIYGSHDKITIFLISLGNPDNGNSYVATVNLLGTKTSSPGYAPFTISGGRREIVLSKGLWFFELSSASQTLLVVCLFR